MLNLEKVGNTVMDGIRMRIKCSNSQFVRRAARVPQRASVVGVRSPRKLPKQEKLELNRVLDRKMGCRWCTELEGLCALG